MEIFSLQVDYTARGSNPWDTVHARCDLECLFPLGRNRPLAAEWQPLPVQLRSARQRADAMLFGPGYWAIRLAASRALSPILGPAVEFLPLLCESGEELVALHPLQLAEIGPGTEGSRNAVTGCLTWVRRYDFEPAALDGMVCFQARESEAVIRAVADRLRRAGMVCTQDREPGSAGDSVYSGLGDVLVPEAVRERLERLGLSGWRFEQVFPVDKRRIR